MVRSSSLHSIAVAVATAAALGSIGTPASAQRAGEPQFIDERRLPPSDAELKQKAEAERRQAAEAEARQKAEAERRQAAEAEAKQKADEQRRQTAEAEAKQKAEAERRQAAEAEARQKADEQRRQAAEAEAKQKAEAERRQAAEAETRQKADEQRRQAAEAEAKQKAEADRRQAAEAEAKQKAEEQRRQAAEAEAKQKAEADRRQAADAEARQKAEAARRQAAPAASPAAAVAATDCAADRIGARAIAGGRVQIEIDAPCRANQKAAVRYGTIEFLRQIDGSGKLTTVLDLFQGKSAPVSLRIGDGPQQAVSLDAVDLSGLSKVAVVWKSAVNLDLHAYEYAARHGEGGHVWAGAPSSAEASEAEMLKSKRGRGFLSTGDDGRSAGEKAEVYTFWHHAEQQSGLVATALDYESRGAMPQGAMCGAGADATVVYEAFLLNPRGELSRERGAIVAAACGTQLTGAGRYMEDAIPDVSARP